MQTKSKSLIKGFIYLFIGLSCFFVGHALAQGSSTTQDLGDIAANVTQSFSGIGKLMIAISYLAGIGFVLASLFKFKQHKDNPTQIPLGTPLALLVIGVILVFLPMIFKPAGSTIFGTNATPGGFDAGGITQIPGSENVQ